MNTRRLIYLVLLVLIAFGCYLLFVLSNITETAKQPPSTLAPAPVVTEEADNVESLRAEFQDQIGALIQENKTLREELAANSAEATTLREELNQMRTDFAGAEARLATAEDRLDHSLTVLDVADWAEAAVNSNNEFVWLQSQGLVLITAFLEGMTFNRDQPTVYDEYLYVEVVGGKIFGTYLGQAWQLVVAPGDQVLFTLLPLEGGDNETLYLTAIVSNTFHPIGERNLYSYTVVVSP